ncbi:serine carboxypeptidase [Hirsutella rhossiliensis]|uniref:Carboxypeptidase n=1 Tax=Hirsutella rhossiliensis TaxID=111463 RepID=A0A9P8SNK4_9HYPO|nr:serine carboxypeptidase domain-containing protein [Hirsutella rhossiliensis]KAH0968494.1 serine carboxypeptidase domain-containing protein [Hirsutella rhossiliensis]
MKSQMLVLSLLSLWATAASARVTQADQLLQRLHGGFATGLDARHEHGFSSARNMHRRADSAHRFLNHATKEFVVNGTGIPDVDFDLGESYAGQLPISEKADERDHMFFWFFPTANEEHRETKEIVIWLNGGPGCSSLLGLLQENGPLLWQPGLLKPESNPWSWHLLSNIVYVEQPVTVGFSQGNATAKDEDDVARQFLGFWKNFMSTFGMQGYKVYVVAESYGGFYGPYISSHMVDANDNRYYDLGGLMIYDGIMFSDVVQSGVIIESFVEQHRDLMPLDDATMERIHNISESCGYTDYYEKYLTYPPAGPAPRFPPGVSVFSNGSYVPHKECEPLFAVVYEAMRKINPCFNIYNIRAGCPQPYDPIGSTDPYFDRADVKKAINAPAGVTWSQCVNGVFNSSTGDQSLPPDKYELPNVVDTTENVIIAHGSMDYILPLDGVLLGLQNMTWGGKLGFQTTPSDPFYVPRYGYNNSDGSTFYGDNLPAGSGVQGTTHHERGLTLVVTHLAGHEGPEYAAASAFRHLEKLLGRVKSLSGTEPFTLPELRSIAQMEKPLGKGTVKIPFRGNGC